MATSDLVTRLRMDDKQFQNAIRKSKNEVENFKKVGNAVGSAIKNLGMQFVAAAGLMETFDTAINSNAITQNKFQTAMGTAKESVDNFFTSLATGDWTVFEDGILNAIKLGKRYTETMRDIQNSMKLGDVRLSEMEKKLNEHDNDASNENKSKSEREKAFAKFKKDYDETVKYVNTKSTELEKRLTLLLSSKGVKVEGSVREMIFKYFDPDEEGAKLLKKYEGLQDKLSSLNSQYNDLSSAGVGGVGLQSLDEEIKDTQKSLRDLIKLHPEVLNAFKFKANFASKEEMEQLLDITDKMISYEDRYQTMVAQRNSLQKDFNEKGELTAESGSGKGTKTITTTVEVKPEKGSIAALEKEISDLEVKYKMVADEKSREEILNKINELKDKVYKIKYKADFENNTESLAKLEEDLKNKRIEFNLATTEESRRKVQSEIDELENKIHTIKFRAKFEQPEMPKDDKSDLKVEMPKAPDKIELPKINNIQPIGNDVLSSITQYGDAISSITGVLGSFNTAQEASAASVLKWVSSSMSGIANMIQVIQSLEAAQVAAAATDAATTTAQVANSGVKIAANTAEGASEAGKQAAKTPVVGWLMVAGAVAAALAAFASIPKFAKGGIFQGGKTFGDMNIARVNSGEMILNNSQQRNLWKLLDGTTSATNKVGGGQVEFKIKGNELVGVLNNYNKKLSRR